MNNYCGFIEVYTFGLETKTTPLLPMNYLYEQLYATKKFNVLKTVAVFKIKLKNNEQKRN